MNWEEIAEEIIKGIESETENVYNTNRSHGPESDC